MQGNKNPPWARGPPSLAGAGTAYGGVGGGGGGGGVQYGAGVGVSSLMQHNIGVYGSGVVAYPTPRSMAPQPFQHPPQHHQPATPHHAAEQRVFTGTVTKTHNDFGFVDQDVFYQTSVCAKGMIPKVNDRVLVEATFNANMPFKWNATRVQVLNTVVPAKQPTAAGGSGYNAVPPPIRDNRGPPPARENRGPSSAERRDNRSGRDDRSQIRREPLPKRLRSRSRSRSKSPLRQKRRESPPKKRRATSPAPKYAVRVPRIPLDVTEADVTSMTQRYGNLYIPSDFFSAGIRWSDTFPPQYPFALNNPGAFHIMNREVACPMVNDAVLEPPDADYKFSVKVMLISLPSLDTLYQKCGLTKPDPKEKRDSSKAPLHPTRLIKFLVGRKDKGSDNFAIGGPWSPSLDGSNPELDPSVLVKTAIRTTKALTGIDLSACTQWYRMVEFYYWREGSGEQKSRLECVVLFLPDVWSAVPSRPEWTALQDMYRRACDNKVKTLRGEEPEQAADESKIEANSKDESTLNESTASEVSEVNADREAEKVESGKEPTHYSKIELRTIKVDQLREELEARSLNSKGLRAQLIARLSKCLKAEEEKEKRGDEVLEVEGEEEAGDNDVVEVKDEKPEEPKEDKGKKEDKEKTDPATEKEIATWKSQYGLPSTPHILVHPSPTARGGKFNCNLATLSLLLDYRITDNKEHSFEIFVFAELFNEMLMRDFGFYIYKTLYTLPEKFDEDKEKEKEKNGQKKEEKEKKDEKEKKEDEKEKKRDKKEEEKDKKKERRESASDNESEKRGMTPTKKRGKGVELPADPYLLLALIYFDTSRCHYIMKRDLQTLFMSLGLQLSRSQVRTVLEKVCLKELFTFKRLVEQIKELATGVDAIQDLSIDGVVAPSTAPSNLAETEAVIAAGNRDLLPLFDDGSGLTDRDTVSGQTKDVSAGGMVMYKNRLVDIGATLASLARSEQERMKLEVAVEKARSVARALRSAATTHTAIVKGLQGQLADTADRLSRTKSRLSAVAASSKIFHSVLKSIQGKVEAVININFEEDKNDEVEIINGPTKPEDSEKPIKEENDTNPEEVKPDSKDQIVIDEWKEEEREKPGSVDGKSAGDNDEAEETEEKEGSKDVLLPENMDIDDKE